MEFNHQLVDIEKGERIDVPTREVETFFLFTPIKEFIVDPENATVVFERLMNLSFTNFWGTYKEEYPRYNLLTMFHPKVKRFEAEEEAKELFMVLFDQLIQRNRFTDDHSLVLGFPSFEHLSSRTSFTVCMGLTFKDPAAAIYFLNDSDSLHPVLE